MKMYVYGLFDISDPRETIVYVGLTRNLRQRKLNHSGHARRTVGKWVREVRANESDFGMRVLELTESVHGLAREAYWIERLNPKLNAVVIELARPKKERAPVKAHDFHGFNGTLGELQMAYVLHVVEACEGDKLQAALKLGIARQTLYNWLA